MEDYLEAIAELIAVDGHAHTKEIARKLGVKMPSVTGALRQLDQAGLIVYNTHYPVVLTELGQQIASDIIKRHTVLTQFFSDILLLPAEIAATMACKIEHAVDENTISRFIILTEALKSRQDAETLRNYLNNEMGKNQISR